jgi:20S proteasome alpha/beta subunit
LSEREERKKETMECVFGLVGTDFAIVVADTSAVHSILVHKSNEDKIMFLDSHKLVAASGEPGDRFHSLFFFFFSFKF